MHVASPVRNSILFLDSEVAYLGILIAAHRFAKPKNNLVGASNPGNNLLKEFVLGLVRAVYDLPCFKIPPIKSNASSERSANPPFL